MPLLFVLVLIVAIIAVLPTWQHSSAWGYYPSGALAVLLLVVVILAATGRLGPLY